MATNSGSELRERRTADKGKAPAGADDHGHDHEQDHVHSHENGGAHSHSHSIFGGHSHGHDEPDQTADQVVQALKGEGDAGSRITLIGLVANIGLTASKGAAGYYMNSASLLADAGHSFSDLIGDFVTLFCWKLSRRPPSARYPFGFAKFETLGTTLVALLLLGGAVGIGVHSYQLLAHALADTAASLPAGPVQTALANVSAAAQLPESLSGSLGHAHEHDILDPNAAWFALLSVGAKEWLYRATVRVADDLNSPVLRANALHHRSDAWGSLVALIAIGGTWAFPAIPLDPIGGFLVSLLILQQGVSVMSGAFSELTDAGVSPRSQQKLERALQPLVEAQDGPSVLGIDNLRARRAGALTLVELTASVPRSLTIGETSDVEERITSAVKVARGGVVDVRVKFKPVDA